MEKKYESYVFSGCHTSILKDNLNYYEMNEGKQDIKRLSKLFSIFHMSTFSMWTHGGDLENMFVLKTLYQASILNYETMFWLNWKSKCDLDDRKSMVQQVSK